MKKLILIVITILSLQSLLSGQSFEIREGAFLLDGKPMRIYGGEMHYARIPREYWRHRIQMVKAMGCNTISIYVMWNYHETAPGTWDWTSDNHDLRAFVELAKAEGMYIILRPGPYVCAEWEFGGFPYWLMNNPDLKLRSNNQPFLDSCRTYLQQVYKQVDGLFIEQGGNIIMTQVENEFGFFAFDTHMPRRDATEYKNKLLAIFREVGFTHTLMTCDGGIIPVLNFARMGHIKGIFPGTNDSKFLATAHHTVRKYFNKKGPYYIPEEYAGWFTHWGDPHMFHRDVEKYKKHIEALLKTDFSFCYYMVHGGTNFGFWNGSNHSPQHDVWPVVTSYDYGAPIDEAGNRTPLYDSLRAVYQRATGATLPDVPAPIGSMAIDSIKLNAHDLLSWLPGPPIQTEEPMTFGQLAAIKQAPVKIGPDWNMGDCCGDMYDNTPAFEPMGYVLYRKRFTEPLQGNMSTEGITDFAFIYVNDSLIAAINRTGLNASIPKYIAMNIPANGDLKILVENMGRINFGKKLYSDEKGITKGVVINGQSIKQWEISNPYKRLNVGEYRPFGKVYKPNQPATYFGTFTLNRTADTYLDMHGFGKGVVFVNGHNIGRYWEIGPQYSLYVPGVWLHRGSNEIVIFDEINHSQQHYISATAKPVNR